MGVIHRPLVRSLCFRSQKRSALLIDRLYQIPHPTMPFFRGASDVVISGGEFNDVSGNLVINDTSERVSNYKSHNTDDVVENDSNNTSSARRGGPARELHL